MERPKEKRRRICLDYLKECCTYGKKCKFRHLKPCYFYFERHFCWKKHRDYKHDHYSHEGFLWRYIERTNCFYYDNCKKDSCSFLHEGDSDDESTDAEETKSVSTKTVVSFRKRFKEGIDTPRGKYDSKLSKLKMEEKKFKFLDYDETLEFPKELKQTKPIKKIKVVLIGQTGSGKSTFLNLLFSWQEKFTLTDFRERKRLLLRTKFCSGLYCHDNDVKNLEVSQTNECTFYPFKIEQDDCIYELVLMDTPGFGDTRGSEQDDINEDLILKNIVEAEELNSILILHNGTQARMDERTAGVLQRIYNILPEEFSENCFFLLSNVNRKPAIKLEESVELKKIGFVPKKENIIFYDNSFFNLEDEDLKDESLNDDYIGQLEKAKCLIKKMETTDLKKIDEFKSIQDNRKLLRTKIQELYETESNLWEKRSEIENKATIFSENFANEEEAESSKEILEFQKEAEEINKRCEEIKKEIFSAIKEIKKVCKGFNYYNELELLKKNVETAIKKENQNKLKAKNQDEFNDIDRKIYNLNKRLKMFTKALESILKN